VNSIMLLDLFGDYHYHEFRECRDAIAWVYNLFSAGKLSTEYLNRYISYINQSVDRVLISNQTIFERAYDSLDDCDRVA
jgi:hypothetical protein